MIGMMELGSALIAGLAGFWQLKMKLKHEYDMMVAEAAFRDVQRAREEDKSEWQWAKRILALVVCVPTFGASLFALVFDANIAVSYSELQPLHSWWPWSDTAEVFKWKFYGDPTKATYVVQPVQTMASYMVLGFYFGSGGTRK